MVRSLDVQQVLLQSNAVERVQQVQQQQGDAQQRHFQAQLLEERRELREKVKTPEESERLMIRDEDRREKREGRQGESGAKEEEKEEGIADTDEPEGKIDIRV
jgi:hypothetical protein